MLSGDQDGTECHEGNEQDSCKEWPANDENYQRRDHGKRNDQSSQKLISRERHFV